MNIPSAGEKVVIRSMAKEKGLLTSKVKDVKLLGYKGKIKWQMTEEGLELTYPEGVSLKTAATWRIVTK